VEDVAGKYATTRLARDQIVLGSQVSEAKPLAQLSDTIPPGKVAFWMALPDLPAQTGGLRAGDRVDVLLTLTIPEGRVQTGTTQAGQTGQTGQTGEQSRGPTTQTTLQNVEVLFVGTPPGATAASPAPTPAAAPGGQTAAPPGTKLAAFVLDPQEAVLAKFIRDSGGTMDLVLRSRGSQDVVATEPVNVDSLVDRFHFRTLPSGTGR
jgi:Flp pilus assembly protein CpaB